MEEWTIETVSGIGPVRFGMSVADVSEVVSGEPSAEDEGSVRFPDAGLRVSVEDGQVVEISVTPLAKRNVTFGGVPVFDGEPFELLSALERDGRDMFEAFGFVMVPALGLLLTGVHDGDRAQLAVTATSEPFDIAEFDDARRVSAAALLRS